MCQIQPIWMASLWYPYPTTRSQPSVHTLGLTAHVAAALSRASAACQRPACRHGELNKNGGRVWNMAV